MKILSLAALTGASLLIAGSALAAVSLTAEISNARTHANKPGRSCSCEDNVDLRTTCRESSKPSAPHRWGRRCA